jgi:hypothetical protein
MQNLPRQLRRQDTVRKPFTEAILIFRSVEGFDFVQAKPVTKLPMEISAEPYSQLMILARMTKEDRLSSLCNQISRLLANR